MSSLEELKSIDLEKLTIDERLKLQVLIKELTLRRIEFPLVDFVTLPHQEEIANAVWERKEEGWTLPKYKYIMFIWGNGSWKTISSVRIDILLALWREGCKKYNLPFIWEARQILVVTKTSDSIKTNLEPYFLWEGSVKNVLKIPDAEIEKIKRDGSTQTLKEITLKNWAKIMFRTYDAWQARLEGSSPDFIHLDELPERSDIFVELLRWTRKVNSQMLLSFTPTKFNSAVHDYFYWQESVKVKEKTFIRQVDSLENTFNTDHDWLEWLSEEEQKIRRYWMFIPPTWLVYNEFMRVNNLVEYVNPRELGIWVKYYWALDFWVNHPMAFLFIAVDWDWHVYVFDMIYQSKMWLEELVKAVREKSLEHRINLEYTVADTADARARLELKDQHWFNTIPADKWSRGENNLSNRRAGIFKINWLFKREKLIISDRCMFLVKELETHAYKWNGSEDVVKLNDDALDALRYFIFSYKPNDEIKVQKRKLKRINKKETNRY